MKKALVLTFTLLIIVTGCKKPDPIASFTYEKHSTKPHTIVFTNTSQNADKFEWMFDDGSGKTITKDVTHTFVPGTYQVLLQAGYRDKTPDFKMEYIAVQ